MIDLKDKTVLVTGGTGSFGRRFVQMALEHPLKKLIVLSRDELKQFEMSQQFTDPRLRFFIGDVRDQERLTRACFGVNLLVHAAAMKQVPAAEYNPMEAIKTNVLGAQNVIMAAIDSSVERVIALSTDKAASPVNLYGATKLCSDKLFIAGNAYAGGHRTRFSVVRYGNVVGSRGSVIPFFMERRKTGILPITDPRMTRFWITIEQGARFVLRMFKQMQGGEIFVPKIPSMNILDLAQAIAPECRHEVVGIRPGEKLHEEMITRDDARQTLEYDDYYVIQPAFQSLRQSEETVMTGTPVPDGFRYASDTNSQWLLVDDLRQMVATL